MDFNWNADFLENQAHLELKNTYDIFKQYQIDKEKSYSILDIGCSNGYNTQLLFKDFDSSTILGIDIDSKRIMQANQNNKSKNFSFYDINLLNTDINWFINLYGKFDIIYCSYVIQYLDSPLHLLKQCYNLLNKNGVLILKVSDDNGKISYPKSDVLNKVINFYIECTPNIDRFCAEKCYCWLHHAGFRNIKYHYYVDDTVNSTTQEKLALYYKDFEFRKYNLQSVPQSLNSKLNEQLALLYELFQQEEFYYSSTSYIIVAQP